MTVIEKFSYLPTSAVGNGVKAIAARYTRFSMMMPCSTATSCEKNRWWASQ